MNSNSGAEFNHDWSGNVGKHPFIWIGKHENPIKAQSLSMQYTFTPFHTLQKDISVSFFSKWSSQIKNAINYALKPTTMYSPLPFNSASTASSKIPVACSICWCVLSASSAQMPGQTNAVLFVTNVWCTGNLSAIPFMVKPVKPLYSKPAITYMQTMQYSNIYNSQQHELQDITHLSLTALMIQLKLGRIWNTEYCGLKARKLYDDWIPPKNIELRHLRASYTSLSPSDCLWMDHSKSMQIVHLCSSYQQSWRIMIISTVSGWPLGLQTKPSP